MALLHSNIWEKGDRKQLGVGYHYKQIVKSLTVPAGQVVTLYENQDRTGKKSFPLYEGLYNDLSFYGVKGNPGVVHIEETDLTHLDMIEICWNQRWGKRKEHKYVVMYKIPIGDRKAGEDFLNDNIQWLYIPFGVTVELFENKDFRDGSLIFSGNTEGKRDKIMLSHYEYSWIVSSMKIKADQWISIGISIEEESIVGSSADKVAATIELVNNSPHLGTVSQEIAREVGLDLTEDWSIEAGVTAKTGFEVGTDTAKVTGELEVSFSAGYGESKTTTKTTLLSATASAEIEGNGAVKASMIAEFGKMEGIAVRKWRNKRNNAIIEQRGKFVANTASKTRVEIHDTQVAGGD